MKILLISNGTEQKDGWSTYTKILVEGLANNEHSILNISNLGSPLSFHTNPLYAIWKSMALRKHIRDFCPDIIHCTVEPYAMMIPFTGKTSAKIILTIHGSYGVRMFHGKINAKRSCKILSTLDTCVTVSNYTKNQVEEEVKAHCGNICAERFGTMTHVIKNGIALPETISNPSNTTKQILCVGGVKPRKGIVESLNALSTYVKNIDDNVHMTIAGAYKEHSPYMHKLQRFISSQSINRFVTFTGALTEDALAAEYQKADLFLMPAKTTHDTFEGFGIVYVEAAGYGIPCIGTNTSGAAEAIDEGVSGYKCDPTNTQAIVTAMEKILTQNTIHRDACRAWAEQHSAKHMVTEIELLYKNLL